MFGNDVLTSFYRFRCLFVLMAALHSSVATRLSGTFATSFHNSPHAYRLVATHSSFVIHAHRSSSSSSSTVPTPSLPTPRLRTSPFKRMNVHIEPDGTDVQQTSSVGHVPRNSVEVNPIQLTMTRAEQIATWKKNRRKLVRFMSFDLSSSFFASLSMHLRPPDCPSFTYP